MDYFPSIVASSTMTKDKSAFEKNFGRFEDDNYNNITFHKERWNKGG